MALRRRYKIQDVIQRRQVLLVQVVKEERGNKGAALTYLSLAGRYCVLMPNSSHGGGISRKISSVADRKRLKSIIAEMDLPKSMGCIVRTCRPSAHQESRSSVTSITSPACGRDPRRHDEGFGPGADPFGQRPDQARHPRHLQPRDRGSGRRGRAWLRDARDFMKLLMPSHARRVKHYADPCRCSALQRRSR
jgi:ribonuclease E